MKKLGVLAALILSAAVANSAVAADKPYSEGPVVVVSNIRVKPGKFEEYMKYLSTTYKTLMEANKKAGLITDFEVFETSPRSPSDPNLVLVVSYPNMAAFDKTAERDAIADKVMGSIDAREKAVAARSDMREQLGTQMMRQLILK